jgi:hypothetical protein
MPKLELFGGTHLELRKNRWTAYLGPTPSQSTVLDIDKMKQRQDLLEEAVMQVWLEAKKNRPPAGKTSIMTEAKITEVKTKGAAVNKALEKPDKPTSSSMISGCRCFCNKELTEICNHIAVTPFLEPAVENRHEGKKDARLDGSIAFPSPPLLPESERSSTEENQMESETEESIHKHNQDQDAVQGDHEGVEAEPFGEASLHVGIMFGPDGGNSGKNLPDSKEGANTTGVPDKNDAKLQGNETDLETIPADITSNQINETDLTTTLTGSSKQNSNIIPDYGNGKENGSGNSDDSSSVGNITSDTTSAVDTDMGDTLVIDSTTDHKSVVDKDTYFEDTTLVPIADPSLSGKIQETGEIFLGSASINSFSSSNISMTNASAAVLLTEPSNITASNGSDVSLSNVTLVFPKITYRRIQAYESVRSGRSDWRFRFPAERRPFTSFGAAPPTRSRRSSGTPEGDSEWGRGGYRYGRSIINLIPMLTEEQERENAEERGFRDTLARVRQLGKTVFIVPFLFLFIFSATHNLKGSSMHNCKNLRSLHLYKSWLIISQSYF